MSLKRKLLVIFLFVVPSFISLGVFYQIFGNEKLIIQSEAKRHHVYLLIGEWRKKSDRLTRMTKAYVVTGKSRFREYLQKALESKPDFSIKKLDFLMRVEEEAHSNLQIIRPLTRDIKLIKKAKLQSDRLLSLEEEAIHAMNGLFQDKKGQYAVKGSPDQKMAVNLLYGQEYQRAKQKLMYFLMEFSHSVERKVRQEIDIYKVKNRRFFTVLWAVQILFILLLLMSLFFVIKPFKQESSEEDGASMFSKRFWVAGKPFILFSLLVILVIASLGRWLYLELIFIGEGQVKQNFESNLDVVNDAVVNWINQRHQTTVSLSENLETNIKTRGLKPEARGSFHKQLEKMGFLNSNQFDDYIVTDPDLIIVSSSQTELIGEKFRISNQILNRIKKFPYLDIFFPERKAGQSRPLLDENVLFASALEKGKKGFLFFLVSPQKDLIHLMSHGFYQTAEVYMVSSQGNFVTSSQRSHELVRKGWLKSGINSVTGIRVSNDMKNPEAPLSHSVNEVVRGQFIKPDRHKNENGIARYKSYTGTRVLGLWRWNSFYQFGIVVEVSYEENFLLRKVFIAQTSLGMIAISLLILLFTIFFIKSRIRMTMINSKLNNSYKTIKNQNDKIAQDLLLGQKVQMDMLPHKITDQGFELDAYLNPAQMMSGDFYDFSFLDDKKKVYFCIGDVSGKGVGAALFMSMTKVSINNTLNSNPDMPVKDIVSIVNRELSKNNASCMFVTLIVGIMDIETGKVDIANAGHNFPYIKKANGELVLLEKVDGPVVGTFEEASFEQQSVRLDHEDTLIFYTDGVTDAKNLNGDFYEENRLERVLGKDRFSSSLHVINAITDDVMNFIGKQDQFDDITIISLRYL